MDEALQNTGQEFWRSPTVLQPLEEPVAAPRLMFASEACAECGSEFMIGARFCHTCGGRRPVSTESSAYGGGAAGRWTRNIAWMRGQTEWVAASWRKLSFPDWLHYLHFHEIQHWVGLPTAALVAFLIGLGCVAGAIGVSLFYRASNLAEFQAIQMWRIEWLLGATASFAAGILLKKPSSGNHE